MPDHVMCTCILIASARNKATNKLQWRIQDCPLRGRRPPTQALFGENVCKNERIGSRWGACTSGAPWIHQCVRKAKQAFIHNGGATVQR